MLQHGRAGIQTRQPSVLTRLIKCDLIMDPGWELEDRTSKFVAIRTLPSEPSQLVTLYVPQCLLKTQNTESRNRKTLTQTKK